MANIKAENKEVTYNLELSQKELNQLVGALQNPLSQNRSNAHQVGLRETLGASEEIHLYRLLRDTALGGQA